MRANCNLQCYALHTHETNGSYKTIISHSSIAILPREEWMYTTSLLLTGTGLHDTMTVYQQRPRIATLSQGHLQPYHHAA